MAALAAAIRRINFDFLILTVIHGHTYSIYKYHTSSKQLCPLLSQNNGAFYHAQGVTYCQPPS